MRKKVALIFASLLILLSFTGCWDRQELNDIVTITALAFDRDQKSGEILMTAQFVRPNSLRAQKSVQESPYDVMVARGSTISEAIHCLSRELDRSSFFSQLRVIVISESYAQGGIEDIIDFISRAHSVRKSVKLMVAKGNDAGRVVYTKHGIGTVQAFYMENIIQSENDNANTISTDSIQFIKKETEIATNPYVGVFHIEKTVSVDSQDDRPSTREKLVFGETAVFKKTKLVGFLDNKGTIGLNFITGAVKSGGISVSALQNPSKKISIEVLKNRSNITPVLNGGKLSFHVRVMLKANVTQVEDATDISEQGNLKKVNDKFEKTSQDEICAAIQQAQALKTDVLGFGRALEMKYPNYWNSISGKWDKLFPNVPYSVQVYSVLGQTGLLQKPLM